MFFFCWVASVGYECVRHVRPVIVARALFLKVSLVVLGYRMAKGGMVNGRLRCSLSRMRKNCRAGYTFAVWHQRWLSPVPYM